ncbi:diguanylate cyclase (GGDEF) domain-containing protein [Thermaerobacter subterraneus DSM 13965]|uniref:Diguanylate cyclase (GGDEF) domain-containing protein n=2 Tax=Thermaerobacter TaxID=73918 RepID=K6PZ89_9FIRM|nr:diguanylate cyclase (GGDEF) domain-containing protein [Thermaerobacter subterraneus DSM 13965]
MGGLPPRRFRQGGARLRAGGEAARQVLRGILDVGGVAARGGVAGQGSDRPRHPTAGGELGGMRLQGGGMGPRGDGPVVTPAGDRQRPWQGPVWPALILVWLAAVLAVYAAAGWVEVWVLAPVAGVAAARRWGIRRGGAVAAAGLLLMAVALLARPAGATGWRLLAAEAAALAGACLVAARGRPAPAVAAVSCGRPAAWREAAAAEALLGEAVPGDRADPAAPTPGAAATESALTESELQALYACTHTLNKVTSLDDLIREFNSLLSARLGYPYLALLLVQPDGSLQLASAPLYPPEVQGVVLPAGKGICSAVVETGEPVIVDDVTRDPRYYPGLNEARSQIAVPVLHGDRVVGVLSVESPLPAAFTRRDLRLLQAIADEVAVALERAWLMERVEQQAITDPLTGLYNRSCLVQRLREEGERAARYGRPLSLLFIDLDDLKLVNDRFGHEAGDQVLVWVARVLKEACRSVDYAARYGGDEFVVVLPETGPEGARAVAARIQQRLLEEPGPPGWAWGRLGVGASIGIAAYPAHARDWTDLLRLADQAMYGAKRRAKARRGTAGDAPGQDRGGGGPAGRRAGAEPAGDAASQGAGDAGTVRPGQGPRPDSEAERYRGIETAIETAEEGDPGDPLAGDEEEVGP